MFTATFPSRQATVPICRTLFLPETSFLSIRNKLPIDYTTEYPINRFYRDAKLFEIGAGTSDIRRIVISEELIKKGTGYL